MKTKATKSSDISSVLPDSTSQYSSKKTGNRKIPTAKQKAFAKEYAKTLNGVQSALKVYDTKDYETANQIAVDNLQKPIVRQEIERLLQRNDIEIGEILTIHKRNLLQDKHLPTSQKAVSDFYEILGLKSNEKPSSEVKIAFIIEK